MWFSTLFSTGFGMLYLALGWWTLAGVVLLMVPFGPLGIAILSRRGALEQAENVFLVAGFLMVGGLIVVTGGAASPAQGWLIFLPMLGLSGISSRMRVETLVVPLVFLGGLHLSAALGWPQPYLLPEGTEGTISAIATLGLVGLMPVWMGAYAQFMHHNLEFSALQAAQQHAEELLDAAQTRQRVLAAASHQLRTPLHGILGCAALLDGADERQQERLGQDITRSGQELLSIVEHMLALAAPEDAEDAPLRPVSVSVQQVLWKAAQAAGLSRSAVVSVDDALGAPVLLDSARLARLLALLLDNCALHAPGAMVQLAAASTAAGQLEILIADDGPGLPDTVRAALFEPFVAGEQAPADRPGSLGLGLWYAQRLADTMGGQLDLVDATRGTRFRLVLPCVAAAAPVAPPPAALLVVEDNAINRAMLRQLLERLGHTVHLATNGAEALTFFAGGGEAELVLMDCQMPVMDGIEATRRLRDAGRAVPIVALTAHSLPAHRDACLAAGMDDFVVKPADADTIQALLRRHCPPFQRDRSA